MSGMAYRYTPGAGMCAVGVQIKNQGPQGIPGSYAGRGDTGPTGPVGIGAELGNTLRVDAVYGNDSTATIGGVAYKTVDAAIAAIGAGTGYTIWVFPGTYNLNSGGITMPAGNALRGISVQTTTLQILNATANTTLLTMGENCRVEDFTIKLTSAGHYTLKGVVFGGTTTATSKLRTCVLTVDNSLASTGGTSNVYGVDCTGSLVTTASSFSFNCVKGSTINVYSNGAGTKRGILISGGNVMSTRDTNIYVAAPNSVSSTGSYVGVETNDGTTGCIQMRSTTVGTITSNGNSYTASDILQTTPSTITNPTYLASPGIQLGPGVDLVTKTAGGKGFSTYSYPTTLFYGAKGLIRTGNDGYLWIGTLDTSGSYPDTTVPAAFYRAQQGFILSGMTAALTAAPGPAHSVTVQVYRTAVGNSIAAVTPYTLLFNSADTIKSYYNASQTFNAGDLLHVNVTRTTGGAPNNAASDLSVQLDCF